MLRHVVLFKKRPDTSEETVQVIMTRLEALQGQIPGLTYIKCHRGLPSERPVVYTFMLDSTLERADQLASYLQHPAHVAVNEFMSPFLESRAVVDFEVSE
jgi:hypothetical protein